MNLRSIEDASDTNVREVLNTNNTTATGIELESASNQALMSKDEPMF